MGARESLIWITPTPAPVRHRSFGKRLEGHRDQEGAEPIAQEPTKSQA